MIRTPTLNPFGVPKNTREQIIFILADRPCLTYRKLLFALKKTGRPMTAQALWKHMTQLLEDGQIVKNGHKEYSISLSWIRALRGFCDMVERRAFDEKS